MATIPPFFYPYLASKFDGLQAIIGLQLYANLGKNPSVLVSADT